MSRNQYIKECPYYENSAFAFTDILIADFEKDIWNKERKEEKIISLNVICLKSESAFFFDARGTKKKV